MNLKQWVRATQQAIESLPPKDQVGRRHFSQEEIAHVIEMALDVVLEELLAGGEVNTHRLGRLKAVERRARVVTNNLPGGGKKTRVPARRTVRYRPSPGLLTRLNDDGQNKVDEEDK